MKIIYTRSKIKGSPKGNASVKYTINHFLDENNPDKAICGFNHVESINVIGIYKEPENMVEYITCKKCLKKLNSNLK